MYPVSSITTNLPQIHFNNILPSASCRPRMSLSLGSPKILHAFVDCSIHAIYPAHLNHLNLRFLITLDEEYNACSSVLWCVCSNANPLHYCALRVPRKVDRWRWAWSIFKSRTAWADHITCGTSICMWWKEGRKWNPVPAHSLLFSKSTKGPPGLTSPSDGRIAEGFGI